MVFVVANKCFLKKRQTKEEEDKACLQKTSYAVNITIVIFSLIAGRDHQMVLDRLLRPVPTGQNQDVILIKGLIGVIIMYVPGKFLRQKILLTVFKVSVGMSLGLVLLVRFLTPKTS